MCIAVLEHQLRLAHSSEALENGGDASIGLLVFANGGLDFSQDIMAANKVDVWGEGNPKYGWKGWL